MSPFWDHVLIKTSYQLMKMCTYLQEQKEDEPFARAMNILKDLGKEAEDRVAEQETDHHRAREEDDRFEQDVNFLFLSCDEEDDRHCSSSAHGETVACITLFVHSHDEEDMDQEWEDGDRSNLNESQWEENSCHVRMDGEIHEERFQNSHES